LQEGICALYGVKKSFILVNGSTQGNLAAFLSLFKDGDTVLISRNIHMSVISACVISGIYPSWMNPPILKNGVIGEVSAKDVQNYINYYPEAKGVFITSPTYNGIITELEKIAEICHKEKKLLIVDEAWGPHLQFWKKEYSAVNFADIVIHSFHKIFPTFSQGSILHICSDRVDTSKVEKAISILTTTSPFYPMLLTISYTQDLLKRKGKELTHKMMNLGKKAQEELMKFNQESVLTQDTIPKNYFFDTSKITVLTNCLGYTGFAVQKTLKKFGIGIDCANPLGIIAPLGFGNTKEDIKAFVKAIKSLQPRKPIKFNNFYFPATPMEIVLSPREVFTKYKKKKVPIDESVGYICAETIAPYPPGIPVLLPGERITEEVVRYLKFIDNSKWKVFKYGKIQTNKLEFIRVIDISKEES